MLTLPEYVNVRVVKLRTDLDHTVISSSFTDPPRPAVNDIATIVDRTVDGKRYLVEKVRTDGYTDWLAEFAEDELEQVL